MAHILITGFPGFLGSAMVPRLLRRRPDTHLVALVQPKFAALARQRVEALASVDPSWPGRVLLTEGDITRKALGLDRQAAWKQDLEAIYHFAAAYDLSVPREIGRRVNLDGTRHVLQLAQTSPSLQRLHYVSTCYVSGRHKGWFSEHDLDVGQRFNNHYEETKFLAECAVQEAMRQGLRTSIYRPAVVVGHSRTGATQKYDGPYYMLRWILRWPRWAPMPLLGDAQHHYLNLVPCDYVIDALDALSGPPTEESRVYHLSDPHPCSIKTLLTLFERATQRNLLRIPLPVGPTLRLARRFPALTQGLGFPPEILDYYVHPTRYACEQTQDVLKGVGVSCPPVASYVDRLVDYMRRYPAIPSKAMT
ncbi:MAG: SDR family oxidoreductase [Bacteroidota bacterium]